MRTIHESKSYAGHEILTLMNKFISDTSMVVVCGEFIGLKHGPGLKQVMAPCCLFPLALGVLSISNHACILWQTTTSWSLWLSAATPLLWSMFRRVVLQEVRPDVARRSLSVDLLRQMWRKSVAWRRLAQLRGRVPHRYFVLPVHVAGILRRGK